jgi:hypothetical protein
MVPDITAIIFTVGQSSNVMLIKWKTTTKDHSRQVCLILKTKWALSNI